MKTKGYSLWLVPDNSIRSELQRLIDQLAHEFDSPSLPPHVTLLGEIEEPEAIVWAKTELLVARAAPMRIYFHDLLPGDEFFRALTYGAYSTGALFELNLLAQVFFMKNKAYSSHLSVAYGKFDTQERLGLVDRAARAEISGKSFVANRIELWKTEGEVSEWKLTQTFPFQKQ